MKLLLLLLLVGCKKSTAIDGPDELARIAIPEEVCDHADGANPALTCAAIDVVRDANNQFHVVITDVHHDSNASFTAGTASGYDKKLTFNHTWSTSETGSVESAEYPIGDDAEVRVKVVTDGVWFGILQSQPDGVVKKKCRKNQDP